MNRGRKLFLNSITGLCRQLIALICGFILPRYLLVYYGSSVNGLVSSITYFLGFITLLEMGIGPVIQSNLFKPLADNDYESISKVIKSSNRFFRMIGIIFLVYIGILCIIFPNIITKEFDAFFTVSLILIISISTIAEYFFGITYYMLLVADQKAYIQQLIGICTLVLNTILCVVLMKCGMSIHIVKLCTTCIFILRPLLLNLYVKKKYRIDTDITYEGEPIKQKWNGFSQHLASVITQNIDVVLLTCFSSLKNVSVYNIYFLVTNGITQIIMTAATGLEAFFGNMIAKGENKQLLESFELVEFVVHFVVSIVFTIASITICSFVVVYTDGIHDANYELPVFGFILVLAYAMQCMRIPYFRVIKAAGHFKETQNGAYISAGINLFTSIILVFKLGLIGVALGTCFAMLYHTCYFVVYLRKAILYRPARYFIKYFITDCIIISISAIISYQLDLTCNSYIGWIGMACKVAGIVLGISAMICFLFYKKESISVLKTIKDFRRPAMKNQV